MSFVVVGATGQLGHLVVEALLARGVAPDDVVALGRDEQRLGGLAELGVRTHHADMDDRRSFYGKLYTGDVVLLISSSGDAVGRRVAQHQVVIDAAEAAGVARIVYTSAPHADDTPLVLAPDHAATEGLLRESPVAATVLRNNWYTENYQPMVDQVRATGRLVSNAGDGRVASATRRDYAEAAAAVMTQDGHEGHIYELSGDTAWSFDDLAAALSDAAGREVVYQPVTADEAMRGLVQAGVDEGTASFVVALDDNIAAGALADADPTLSAILGRPTTPLADGLVATGGA